MSTLVRNVWVDGRFYGPDHGGDAELPAELVDRVPADAWSTPPAAVHTDDHGQELHDQLDAMTRDDLVACARRNNIKVNPRGRVADLREVLRAAL